MIRLGSVEMLPQKVFRILVGTTITALSISNFTKRSQPRYVKAAGRTDIKNVQATNDAITMSFISLF
jgi:hypothetical protein